MIRLEQMYLMNLELNSSNFFQKLQLFKVRSITNYSSFNNGNVVRLKTTVTSKKVRRAYLRGSLDALLKAHLLRREN